MQKFTKKKRETPGVDPDVSFDEEKVALQKRIKELEQECDRCFLSVLVHQVYLFNNEFNELDNFI